MNTPICDFVQNYAKDNKIRAHMPGHKGKLSLGVEHLDITEIKGADSLFEASSIIKQSEDNASKLFDAYTYYSCEGSSLSIRAMLYLALMCAKSKGRAPLILALRNVHKTFVSAAALLNFDIEWMFSETNSYLSSDIDSKNLDEKLSNMHTKPVALYVTSPDYLGNILDIKSLSSVCKKHDVLLLVDNAHGAYLKFLPQSLHPTDLGADMCCDSAHKTLPVLTGGAYLHISKTADSMLNINAKKALSLFASTSPSYLILQSLDMANKYIEDGYAEKLRLFIQLVTDIKNDLSDNGYTLVADEPLKITIATKSYGYEGIDFSDILRDNGIECEFADPDFVVLMLSPSMTESELIKIRDVLATIKRQKAIKTLPPRLTKPKRIISVRDAVFSSSEMISAKDSIGKTLATLTVSCPPAVPIVVSGEEISESAVECFKYYGIEECEILAE